MLTQAIELGELKGNTQGVGILLLCPWLLCSCQQNSKKGRHRLEPDRQLLYFDLSGHKEIGKSKDKQQSEGQEIIAGQKNL